MLQLSWFAVVHIASLTGTSSRIIMSFTKFIFSFSLLLATCCVAHAEPGYYLVSTYENEGEKTVDFKYWSVKIPGDPIVRSPEIGFGYGVTKRWYTELYLSYLKPVGQDAKLVDITWQNDFLLTQGQYPFDLALHTAVKKYRDPGFASEVEYFEQTRGYNLSFGPVFQTEVGRTQFNANLLFDRNYRAEHAGRMQMNYQWQVKYRLLPALHLGLQGFGELGDYDHWAPRDQQSHRAGPMLAGSVPLPGGIQTLKYDVSYLTGSIFAEHANVFSMRVQYAF